ncbi:MAG: hypothetical protein DWI57_01695 [Chloroflexi bacterium]|nr:MAG: hypothetical protein DWI57_01695 [Chloroflexota bacterium]
MTELPSSPQTINPLPDSKRPWRLLSAARGLLAFALVSLLALWLVSLPEYFTRVTTLTMETYSQAGEVITSNELVQTQAGARGLSLAAYALYEIALTVLLMAPFWLVAGLILWRAQGEWFGWLTALVLAGLGAVGVQEIFSVTQPLGLVEMLVDLVGWVVWPPMFVWFFLFPGGGAIPRWAWRLVVVLQAIFLALNVRAFLAAWGLLAPDPANLQFVLGLPIALATVALVLYAQAYRYRRVYSAVEKQQVKWFVFAMALLLVELVIFAVAPPDEVSLYVQDLFGLGLLVIPISIGIAILRYRLWDIDVIIRKTLVYSVLTALLALVYFGGVVLLQRLFGTLTGVEQSPLAIVVSTLTIAALFTPLRRRIQDALDRRFFRKKYDAQQVLAQFAITARDETDLDALTGELQRVVQETLQPERVSVWLRQAPTGSSHISNVDGPPRSIG